MPSKYGFGNTRKKSPVYKKPIYGEVQRNPIKRKMETLPGIDAKLDAKSPGTSPMTKKTGKILPVTRPNLITPHAPPANKQKVHTLKGKTGFEYDMIPVSNALNKAGGVVKKGLKTGLKTAKKMYIDQPVKVAKKIHKYFTEK